MNRESIMTALFNLLVGSIVTGFTGDLHGDAMVDNLSSTSGLFLGLPVFGAGIPRGAVITSIGASSIALSLAATATGTAVPLTTGFQTTGRRVLLWSKVAAQPAMFLRDSGNEYGPRPINVLPKITLEAEIWLYSKAGADPDVAPTIALNAMLDAIDATLKPSGADLISGRQTLGGLVEHCWVEGRVEIDPGDLDGQAKAVVPLKILVPF